MLTRSIWATALKYHHSGMQMYSIGNLQLMRGLSRQPPARNDTDVRESRPQDAYELPAGFEDRALERANGKRSPKPAENTADDCRFAAVSFRASFRPRPPQPNKIRRREHK